jgi:EpsI family protein
VTQYPLTVGPWQGQEVTILPEVLEILGKGEFTSRLYSRNDNEPVVDFFLAYFPSQKTGDTIHSPKNCLPGAGWSPVESGHRQVRGGDGSLHTVNRYVIGKGLERQVVLYWYQAHGRIVASEYWAKIYLVADAIRMNRTDGALVRVITQVSRTEDLPQAERRVVEFAEASLRGLDSYVPH